MLNKKTFEVNELFMFIVLFLGILPASSLGGLALSMQYLFLPFFLFVVMMVFSGKVKVPAKSAPFLILWLFIVIEVIFSGTMNPIAELGSFKLPTEAANYIARFFFFTTFLVLFNKYDINLKRFMNIFIFVLGLGMMVGVLQFFNWPGSSFFREAYTFGEQHLKVMNYNALSSRRISGVGNFATATGGIAAFTMVLILSMHFFYEKNPKATFVGLSLVIFNIVTSQARMGYLTIGFAFIVLYLVYNSTYKSGKKWFKSTSLFAFLGLLTAFVLNTMYNNGNEFIMRAMYRWEVLADELSDGGNRLDQIDPALSQIDSLFNFLFGISRGVEGTIPGLWIEIEPLSIFVLYGAIGFSLFYILVFLLCRYFFINIKHVKGNRILLAMTVASLVSLLSYIVFSFAYWFFREIYVGLFPWILMGATMGAIERYKKNPLQFNNEHENIGKTKRKKHKLVWRKY